MNIKRLHPGFCGLLVCLIAVAAHGQPDASPITTTPLPDGRAWHGSAIMDDYLFVLGGETRRGPTNSVVMARIRPDGQIGPWTPNNALPVALSRMGAGITTAGNTVYICGGWATQNTNTISGVGLNRVVFGRVNSDGFVEKWQMSSPFAEKGLAGTAAATNGKYLYIIGGEDPHTNQPSSDVYFAPIYPEDGTIGIWKKGSPLPVPVAFGASGRIGDGIYTIGGRTGVDLDTTTDRVFRAGIGGGGELTAWSHDAARLMFPTNSFSMTISESHFVVIGGISPHGTTLESIQYSAMSTQGLRPWDSRTTDIQSRVGASAAHCDFNKCIYIIGGSSTYVYPDYLSDVTFIPAENPSAPQPDSPGNAGPQSFLPLVDAIDKAAREERNLLLVFYSKDLEQSHNLYLQLSTNREFFVSLGRVIPTAIEVSGNQALVNRYGIVRVPTFVLVNSRGDVVRSRDEILTLNDALAFIQR